MFTPSEDELHRRGMRSILLSQHELAFSIAFYVLAGQLCDVMPEGVKVTVLADRGFASCRLMTLLKEE